MKIVIADDNAGLRKSLKMVLGDEFEQVVSIGDPSMLPALTDVGDVDAVLLDMNFDNKVLDGSDGIRWLRRIKESPCAPAVVMITAFGDVPLAVEAMKYGAEDFVTKPWDNEELIAKIHNAIHVNSRNRSDRRMTEDARKIIGKEDQRAKMTLDELKLDHVERIVRECDGNMTMAASRLGINRQTLYNILKKR